LLNARHPRKFIDLPAAERSKRRRADFAGVVWPRVTSGGHAQTPGKRGCKTQGNS
jgi:hypothetical protein